MLHKEAIQFAIAFLGCTLWFFLFVLGWVAISSRLWPQNKDARQREPSNE